MSAGSQPSAIDLASEPRAHLLPPEVGLERAARATRRRLGMGIIGALAVVLVIVGGVSYLAVQAEGELRAAQDHTNELLAQQAALGDVRKMRGDVSLVTAAQQVGASTEIDWKAYLEKVQATLPASVAITKVGVDSATPMLVYAQPDAPLQGARVATVDFTVTSTVLPDVPTWLNALATLPGYADALPGSVVLDTESGVYTVDITMHVNSDAFANRFAPKEGE